MELTFEWDPAKAQTNLKKHAVSFNEATTVFDDVLGITIFDPDHSESDDRLILFGRSAMNRFLLVVHTDMHNVVRIISVRELTRIERNSDENEIIRRKGL
jgi:uncharacterized DUF497 family protein